MAKTLRARDGKAPSIKGLWWAEHRGLLVGLAILLVVGTPVLLYFLDVIPENIAGMLVACVVILAGCGYSAFALLDSARTNAGSVLGVTAALLAAALSLLPAASTLVPGRPLAQKRIHAAGESLALPSDLTGGIRMLIHGNFGMVNTAEERVTLQVGEQRIEGVLERKRMATRLGRRGRGTVSEHRDSIYLSGTVPHGVHAITIASLSAPIPGGLDINVYRERVPFVVDCAAAGALLILAAALSGRMRAGASPTALLGISLAFGLGIYVVATPEQAVHPEIGVLLAGAMIGTAAGGTLGWMGTKLLGGGAQQRDRTARRRS